MKAAALRLAVTTFTVLPLRPGRVDRETAGGAMLLAPLVGLALGVAAAAVLFAGRLGTAHGDTLLPAALAVSFLAVATRALHLDGLADAADAVGCRDREHAMAAMRTPTVGAFGVAAVALVLLVDVAALAEATAREHGTTSLVAAVLAGRLGVTWACRRGVPAARADGLGALVAGTVPVRAAAVATGLSLVVVGVAAAVDDRRGWAGTAHIAVAMAAGLLAAELLRRGLGRKLGGVTGDVLGAVVETATCVTLVVAALGPG